MEQNNQGMAVGSLVCGILGFLIPPLGIVAVVLGHVQKNNIKQNPTNYGGDGLATAGLVCGYISIGFGVILYVVLGGLFFLNS